MDRTCPKCGAVKTGATWKMDEACPACGAIFAKAVAAANAPIAKPDRRKDSPWAILVLGAACLFGAFHFGNAMFRSEPPPVASEFVASESVPVDSDLGDAIAPCKQAIERQARYQARWEGGWARAEFTKIGRAGPGAQYVAYGGDQLSLQNGFGAWEKMSYVCIWNPDAKTVVQAEVVSTSSL
jgi:hypothetical protein